MFLGECVYQGLCFGFSGQDTRIRFSLDPSPGDPGFNQWKDAMKMVARLPEGVPAEFRKKVPKFYEFLIAVC
jgi:hypothetical protein